VEENSKKTTEGERADIVDMRKIRKEAFSGTNGEGKQKNAR